MTDDTAAIDRQHSEVDPTEDASYESIMATSELRQLLEPADELITSLGNDLQPQQIPESDDDVEPAGEVQQPVAASNDAGLEVEREAEVDPGCDPYNRL